jgi:hypothetical protein
VRALGSGQYRARQAASLANERYAVLVEDADDDRLVALFEGKRLRGLAALGLDAGVIRPSPRGRYLAVLSSDGVHVADLDGRGITLPDVSEPHAIGWSPDDRWTALAAESELFIFPTGQTGGPLIGVPLAVRDLDWGAPE